jgi:hypothetical protein
MKRLSLMGRKHNKGMASEKKRASGGTDISQTVVDGQPVDDAQKDDSVTEHTGDGPGPRQLYFNLPLPRELQDDDGHPIQQFTRNKIRTAKYTPLSFIPKNLFFQFQNIANIFFLFLVILVVSPPRPPNPPAAGVLTDGPILVLPYFRRRQSWPQCRPPNIYYLHHVTQRRHRRLPKIEPRQ